MSDGPYDPNAVEGEKPQGQQYVTLKDLRSLGIGLLLFAPFLFFAYKYFKRNSDKVVCTSNLKAAYDAINQYAEQHDNRFPPIARTEVDGRTPSLDAAGRPYTWISDASAFMGARHSFLCPGATEAETVKNESSESASKSVLSSYGMYTPYGGVLNSLVESPDDAILLAETSNGGALGTLDPVPFGPNVPDGFVIGWSDSNVVPTKATRSVTRLALPGGKEGRHGTFSLAMSASGQLITLTPGSETYASTGQNPHWRVPTWFDGRIQ